MSLYGPKARKRVARNQCTEEEPIQDALEQDVLPRKMLKPLDREDSKDQVLDGRKCEVANEDRYDSLSKQEERVEDAPDEEESGVLVVEMKWKTPMEKERSRQGRLRQLQEYRKREAVLARQERYMKRCRGLEACDSGASDPSGPSLPEESKDTSPRKRVRWKRDASLVMEHEMATEDDSENVDSDVCEKPFNSGS